MRSHILYFLILIAGALGLSRSVLAQNSDLRQTLQELQRRMDLLESQTEELSLQPYEEHLPVRSFLSDRLTLGGFFESAITTISGADNRTQATASPHVLGLNLAAAFSDEFRFVAQMLTTLSFPIQNPDNDPRATPAQRSVNGVLFAALPAQAYVEYSRYDKFRVQVGLGYAPFGHALQQRELVLFVRRGGPMILRMQDLVTPLWAGLQVHGLLPGDDGRLGYNAYTFTPFDEPAVPGIGGRVWWTSLQDSVTFGISTQAARRDGSVAPVVGADLALRLGRLNVFSEFARRFAVGDDPWTIYLEPNYAIIGDQLLAYVFADYGRNSLAKTLTATGALNDSHQRIEYGGGLNWLPTAYTRFRVGIYVFDYVGDRAVVSGQNRDWIAYDLSAGVAF